MSAITDAMLTELTPEQLKQLAERLRPYMHSEALWGDPGEAARQLGVHRKTLVRWARDGRVRGAERLGRLWRFRLDALAVDAPADPPQIDPRPRRPGRPRSGAADAIRGRTE